MVSIEQSFLERYEQLERERDELRDMVIGLNAQTDEMEKRLMPEGCEWPRFEDGARIAFEDELPDFARTIYKTVKTVKFQADGTAVLTNGGGSANVAVIVRPGERVKRPAPKVLDTDGVEIRVGDRVWSTQLDGPHEWIVIDPHEDRDDSQTVLVSIGDRTGHARPENLTHQRPVLAADGRPLREGETVYLIGSPTAFVVDDIMTRDGCPTVVHLKNSAWCFPQHLTHERPVADYRHPERVSRRTARPVDRDALLAVTETLEDCAGRGSDLTALGCSCLAKRIREACGEAVS